MKKAYLVAGLLFGDEGKGATVDWLTAQHGATLNVRYNGGPQAAHNVITPEGKHHTFNQFGSGTLAGAQTYLSRFMRVDPFGLKREAEELEALGVVNPLSKLIVDARALVVTPFHAWHSQWLEQGRVERGQPRGTCGMGVGAAAANAAVNLNALKMGDLHSRSLIYSRLKKLQQDYAGQMVEPTFGHALDFCTEFYYDLGKHLQVAYAHAWEDVRRAHDVVIFEGAQGVMLDRDHGFRPYVTSSDCTYQNANRLIDENNLGERWEVERVGCLRAYSTRHGHGPFPTETDALDDLPEPHNGDDGFQGKFRRGWLDAYLAKKSIDLLGGVDWIALSHLDQWDSHQHPAWNVCEHHWESGNSLGRLVGPRYQTYFGETHFLHSLEGLLETRVMLRGNGPKRSDREWGEVQ